METELDEKDLPEPRVSMTTEELAQLLGDRTFTDYFNVFLSLPVFSQRLLYRFDEKKFDFDPPLQRKDRLLDKTKIVGWLQRERLPYFVHSEIYIDYLLCQELLKCPLHLSPSSHRVDYEWTERDRDKQFVLDHVGHMIGMCRFRQYIAGTKGEPLLRFWKDAERFRLIPVKKTRRKRMFFRELQLQYAQSRDIVRFDEPDIQRTFSDAIRVINQELQAIFCGDQGILDDDVRTFYRLQTVVMVLLKDYWLPKYLLHCRIQQLSAKQAAVSKERADTESEAARLEPQQEAEDKSLSLSNLNRLEDVDLMLRFASGNVKPVAETTRQAAKFGFHALFPQVEVDDSFLKNDDEVITLHKGGRVEVDKMNSEKLEKELEAYFLDSDSSSDEESEAWTNKPCTPVTPTNGSRTLSGFSVPSGIVTPRGRASSSSRATSRAGTTPQGRRTPQDRATPQGRITPLERALPQGRMTPRGRLKSPSANQRRSQTPTERSTLANRPTERPSNTTGTASGNTSPGSQTRSSSQNETTESPDARESEISINGSHVRITLSGLVQEALDDKQNSRTGNETGSSQSGQTPSRTRLPQITPSPGQAAQEGTQSRPVSSMPEPDLDDRPSTCPATSEVKVIVGPPSRSAGMLPLIEEFKQANDVHRVRPTDRKQRRNRKCTVKVALPPIAEVRGDPAAQLYRTARAHDKCEISLVDYERKAEESVHQRGSPLFVRALAADECAGKPFLSFLRRQGNREACVEMKFWLECQRYLTLVNNLPTANNSMERLRYLRARLLILRYLSEYSVDRVDLPASITEALARLVPDNKGANLLRVAQDCVVQDLMKQWKLYAVLDREHFIESTMLRTTKMGSNKRRCPVLGVAPPYALNYAFDDLCEDMHLRKQQEASRLQKERTDSAEQEEDKSVALAEAVWLEKRGDYNFMGLAQRRMWRALRLAAHILSLDTQPLRMECLQLDEVKYCPHSQEGSLSLHKVTVVRRRELIEEQARRRRALAQERADQIARVEERRRQEEEAEQRRWENLPPFARPFKKDGRLVFRPPRPRTFIELLRNPAHVEFFRRFLNYHNSDTPVLFWKAVEELKNVKEPKVRLQWVNHIFRKFFLSPRRFSEMDCNAEVIMEIPKMEKVPQAMMISAQSCVAVSLESRWFHIYLATFYDEDPLGTPEAPASSPSPTLQGPRKWNKKRTQDLWTSFVRTIIRFRECLFHPNKAPMFVDFIRFEVQKEIEKQRATGNVTLNSHGVPVRKVIQNRLVDMSKLPADVAFLAESMRFRTFCDNAAAAAKAGTYRIGDQTLLEDKASTIIECFIDSEVPPKIQINITPDYADTIVDNFTSGMVDRGLFHAASMCVFPILVYMFKKFRKWQYALIFKNYTYRDPRQHARELAARNRGSAPPDYLNIDLSKCRTINTRHTEEDVIRVLFSLTHGLRMIVPVAHFGRGIDGGPDRRISMFYQQALASRASLRGKSKNNLAGDSQHRPASQMSGSNSKVKLTSSSGQNKSITSTSKTDTAEKTPKEAAQGEGGEAATAGVSVPLARRFNLGGRRGLQAGGGGLGSNTATEKGTGDLLEEEEEEEEEKTGEKPVTTGPFGRRNSLVGGAGHAHARLSLGGAGSTISEDD